MIANKPTYRMIGTGGDLSFFSDAQCEPIVDAAVGTPEGEPVAMTGKGQTGKQTSPVTLGALA